MPDPSAAWACEQVLLRLFRALDENDIDDLARLFTPDGEWHRMGRVLRGPTAIRAAMAGRPATQVVRHIVTNVLFRSCDGAAAACVASMTAYRYDDGTPAALPVRLAGPFLLMGLEARFQREERWKLASLVMRREIEFSA